MKCVGNDVVDLGIARGLRKSEDLRFIKRIFTKSEKEAIFASNDPEAALWIFWAAKEAAFKLLSKKIGPLVFSHKKFEISFADSIEDTDSKGKAAYLNEEIFLLLQRNADYIHVLATEDLRGNVPFKILNRKSLTEESSLLAEYRNYSSGRECESAKSEESQLVRLFTRGALAELYDKHWYDFEIIRNKEGKKWMPPVVYFKGQPFPCDISMSHDGQFLAWTLMSEPVFASII